MDIGRKRTSQNTAEQTLSHTQTHILPLLLVLFMYLRVPSITVYPVCTQPADLMSPVFIYLRLLGKEGVWSQIQSCTDRGKLSSGKHGEARCMQLSAFENFTGEQNHSVSQLVRETGPLLFSSTAENTFCSCARVLQLC